MPLMAAFTLLTVYAPLTFSSAAVAISASRKPIWLKLPMPPETFEPYCLRIASYSFISGSVLPSGGARSAVVNSLWLHFGPSALARKSVLHGVEQAHALTRFSRPSFWAAWRMTRASGGVKLSTTAPLGPASLTRRSATELSAVIGTVSVSVLIGTWAAAATAVGPAAM